MAPDDPARFVISICLCSRSRPKYDHKTASWHITSDDDVYEGMFIPKGEP